MLASVDPGTEIDAVVTNLVPVGASEQVTQEAFIAALEALIDDPNGRAARAKRPPFRGRVAVI